MMLGFLKFPSRNIQIFFQSATFSLRIQKFTSPRICPSTRIRHVIRIHSSTQDSSWNIGNRACVVKRTKFASYSAFYVKELGLILIRHRINKSADLASTRFRSHSVFKNFHSRERTHKVADSYARFTRYVWTEAVSRKKRLRIKKYPDTCGQGLTCVISNISFVNF